jgi:hypothetical protein
MKVEPCRGTYAEIVFAVVRETNAELRATHPTPCAKR